MAGREFGGHERKFWRLNRQELLDNNWLESLDLGWQPDPDLRAQGGNAWQQAKQNAWAVIRGEIEELQQLMQDDRDRYLAEIDVQADNGPDYIVAFVGAHIDRFPWTIELIDCGLSIGNIAYSFFKNAFRRVRPSFLCPGLAPPFGPPGHPSFPSGHSFLSHLMALLLLEVPGLQRRYGIFDLPQPNQQPSGAPGKKVEPYPRVTMAKNSASITVNAPGFVSTGLSGGEKVVFYPDDPTKPLPPEITAETTYYVLPSNLTQMTFQVSATSGGAVVTPSADGTGQVNLNPLMGRGAINSPLLWLSQRIAKGRERLGVHYMSDSMGSRHFAAAIWRALRHEKDPKKRIDCPTLDSVIRHARAEWSTG
jgi:hypothetical protein